MTPQKPTVGREKCTQQRELREPQRRSQSNTTHRKGGALHSDRGRADIITQVLASDFCSAEYWTECLILLLFIRCDLGFYENIPLCTKRLPAASQFWSITRYFIIPFVTAQSETRCRFPAANCLLSAESQPAPSKRALCPLDAYIPSLSSSTAVSLLSLCSADDTLDFQIMTSCC